MKKIICSLFQVSSVNMALDNLSEADFPDHAISVKAEDTALAEKLASDAGPFKGLSLDECLAKLKSEMPAALYQAYQDAVQKGMLVVALSVTDKTSDAAKEILSDSGGEEITLL